MDISRRNPWTLYPESICPSFLDNPAVDRLQGDQYWKIDIEFEYTGNNPDQQKDIFCKVPKYSGISIFEKRLFVGIGYDDEDEWIGTDHFIEPNTLEKFTYEHIPGEVVNIIRNGENILQYDISNRSLAIVDEPIIFICTQNHLVKDQSSEIDIRVYLFKITVEDGVICEHDFQDLIHNKSIDKSGNNNFLFQMA